jgi:hypothetical protein
MANVNSGAQPDLRSQYQQVVRRNYPGFRMLQVHDFTIEHQGSITDGTMGSLWREDSILTVTMISRH